MNAWEGVCAKPKPFCFFPSFYVTHIYIIPTMSYFGGGMQQQQQQAINPQNIAMAEQELEMVTDLFNR